MADKTCELYGLPSSDGRTYRPPCAWDPALESLRAGAIAYCASIGLRDDLLAAPDHDLTREQELEYLLSLAAWRDVEAAQIAIENNGIFSNLLLERVGVIRTDPAYRSVVAFVDHVDSAATVAAIRFKGIHNRVRPFQIERRIAPLFCPGHPAYPSGHATQAMSIAIALSAIAPEASMRIELYAWARLIAHRREVAGVHYPSDTVAGFLLAHALVQRLEAVDTFYREKKRAAAAELA